MLKKFLLALMLLCLLPFPALAGFDEGKAAYDRKDWVTTIIELRPLANAGDDRAMVLIGNMYYSGYGVIQSYKEALSLYRRAATEKGNPDAMLVLGAMYTSGEGVERNLHAALKWYLDAANLGNPAAAFFYATILFQGNRSTDDDIKPDFYNAYKWFRISAKGAGYPKLSRDAAELADRIARLKLSAQQVAKADKEAAEWKPSAFK